MWTKSADLQQHMGPLRNGWARSGESLRATPPRWTRGGRRQFHDGSQNQSRGRSMEGYERENISAAVMAHQTAQPHRHLTIHIPRHHGKRPGPLGALRKHGLWGSTVTGEAPASEAERTETALTEGPCAPLPAASTSPTPNEAYALECSLVGVRAFCQSTAPDAGQDCPTLRMRCV
ncbi:hypothetical protein BV20DRAFT_960454 [Pilatotrama ljubarskyi]|nr:hypothetical protein BV20DRAFT_960454 [Pilatotrama ljubarskyi]